LNRFFLKRLARISVARAESSGDIFKHNLLSFPLRWLRRGLTLSNQGFYVRLEDERSCILVLMGADEHGNEELIAVQDGYRESKQSWRRLLLRLKERGLSDPAKLAVGDGALGFRAAMDEIYP
jgi:hypothetical protein